MNKSPRNYVTITLYIGNVTRDLSILLTISPFD